MAMPGVQFIVPESAHDQPCEVQVQPGRLPEHAQRVDEMVPWGHTHPFD
jgi:hypothetical protein